MIFKHRYAPLVVGVLLIAVLAGWMALFRSSPGDLSAAHAPVAGSSFVGDCRKCHDPKGLTAGCLSCHAEIGAQLERKTGYHGRTIAAKSADCKSCHSEHNGKPFLLINKVSWGGAVPAVFPHDGLDYALKGKHASLSCAECHEKKAPPFALGKFPETKRRTTFLGLSQSCTACHKDPHAGGKVTDCVRCHGQDSWKPAAGFDHDKYYPLRDKHAAVSCAGCHAGAATATAVFGPVKGKTCSACHATPHRTKWTAACSSCHGDRATPWDGAAARMTRVQHGTTGFSLAKPHDKASCRACHDPALPYARRFSSSAGRPREPKSCEACHKDPHAGQFVAAHPRCLDCHGEKAFRPSRIGVKEHSAYLLVGGHAKARCSECHVNDPKLGAVRFAGAPRVCASCHRDPHVGQFRAKGVTLCEDCHRDAAAWKKTVFDHTSARFKLDSAHAGVACAKCHPTVALPDGRRTVQYKPLNMACADCHDFKQ